MYGHTNSLVMVLPLKVTFMYHLEPVQEKIMF